MEDINGGDFSCIVGYESAVNQAVVAVLLNCCARKVSRKDVC